MADSNEEALQRELQRLEDYKHVFGTDAGQRVLHDLENFCGLLSDGFDPDPNVTAYNAGRRSVGVYILRQMELTREQLQEMARQRYTEDEP